MTLSKFNNIWGKINKIKKMFEDLIDIKEILPLPLSTFRGELEDQ